MPVELRSIRAILVVGLWLAACMEGCATTPDPGPDTGECTIEGWDDFVDEVVPLNCRWRQACDPSGFHQWWDTLEGCEDDVRGQFENMREDVEDNGCGPFVVEAGCVALDCYAQFAEDCDADCEVGRYDQDWFDPSCHTDY